MIRASTPVSAGGISRQLTGPKPPPGVDRLVVPGDAEQVRRVRRPTGRRRPGGPRPPPARDRGRASGRSVGITIPCSAARRTARSSTSGLTAKVDHLAPVASRSRASSRSRPSAADLDHRHPCGLGAPGGRGHVLQAAPGVHHHHPVGLADQPDPLRRHRAGPRRRRRRLAEHPAAPRHRRDGGQDLVVGDRDEHPFGLQHRRHRLEAVPRQAGARCCRPPCAPAIGGLVSGSSPGAPRLGEEAGCPLPAPR